MAEPATGLPQHRGELLVVDDEPFLCDAVAASLRFLGLMRPPRAPALAHCTWPGSGCSTWWSWM
jgi:hypothetical protein